MQSDHPLGRTLFEEPEKATKPEGPLQRMQALVESGRLQYDPAQTQGIEALDQLWHRMCVDQKPRKSVLKWPVHWLGGKFGGKKPSNADNQRALKSGVYLYGDVGRGKSMMMDLFYDSVPFPQKRRLHFHTFMADIHNKWRTYRQQTAFIKKGRGHTTLEHVIDTLYADVTVLCFDEFHVTNVADAMLLSRIFTRLWQRGVVTVMTSNWPPDELYQKGLQRQRFLPFLERLKTRVQVVEIKGTEDFRQSGPQGTAGWLFPLTLDTNKALQQQFSMQGQGRRPVPLHLQVCGRSWSLARSHQGRGNKRGVKRVVLATFTELFQNPYGAADYQALADAVSFLLIADVPAFSDERLEEVKRFMTFVDVVYEARIRLMVTAEVALEALYPAGKRAFEFRRTTSRLQTLLLLYDAH